MDFCQGITLHHLPGHTDGLIGMQINLPDSGTFLFISDHCHVIENVSGDDKVFFWVSADVKTVARRNTTRLAGSGSPGMV